VFILPGPEWEKEPTIPENDQRNKGIPCINIKVYGLQPETNIH
jgi:hypothetical protein